MTARQRKKYGIGIDGGNSDGKGAMIKGRRMVTMTLPSTSTRGSFQALATARIADGSQSYTHLADVLQPEEYVLSYQGPQDQHPIEEFFGTLALKENPYQASSGRGNPSRSWSGRLLKL